MYMYYYIVLMFIHDFLSDCRSLVTHSISVVCLGITMVPWLWCQLIILLVVP